MRHPKLKNTKNELTKQEIKELQDFYNQGIKQWVNKFNSILTLDWICLATIKSWIATWKIQKKAKEKIFSYINKNKNVYSLPVIKENMNTS